MRWTHRLVLLPLAIATCARAEPPKLQIVVNPSAPTTSMSRRSVRDVFLFKRQFWANQQAVMLVLQEQDEALHAAFCQQVLEAPCEVLEKAEAQRRTQGALVAVVVHASSADDAAALVSTVPGAIGYFRPGTVPPGARVVLEH